MLIEQAEAHGVAVTGLQAGVGLHAPGEIGLGEVGVGAVEHQFAARRIGNEAGARPADERCQLDVEPLAGELEGKHGEMGLVALVLVEQGRIELAAAFEHELRGLAGAVGYLETGDRAAAEQRNPAGLAEQQRRIAEAAPLPGAVVDRIAFGRRVGDAEVALEIACRNEQVEPAKGVAPGGAGLDRAVAATIDADIAARIESAAAGPELDHAGGAEAVLRGQCASDHRDRLGDAGVDESAEPGNALGHGDAVEPVLDIAVFVADVDFGVRVAVGRHPRHLQQNVVQVAVRAAGQGIERRAIERGDAGAERGLDRIARGVEFPGGDDDVAGPAGRIATVLARRGECRRCD